MGKKTVSKYHDAVSALLLKGATNGEIAKELGVAISTAKYHINRAYRSVGAKNRVEFILKNHKGK